MTDAIPLKGFNRVELIVREDQIDDAVRQFNEVLGLCIVPPHRIKGVPILSATDFDGAIEFVAPLGDEAPFAKRLARGGPGQIGPLVWEVEDIDQTREWLSQSGYRIFYEYDRAGSRGPRKALVSQRGLTNQGREHMAAHMTAGTAADGVPVAQGRSERQRGRSCRRNALHDGVSGTRWLA